MSAPSPFNFAPLSSNADEPQPNSLAVLSNAAAAPDAGASTADTLFGARLAPAFSSPFVPPASGFSFPSWNGSAAGSFNVGLPSSSASLSEPVLFKNPSAQKKVPKCVSQRPVQLPRAPLKSVESAVPSDGPFQPVQFGAIAAMTPNLTQERAVCLSEIPPSNGRPPIVSNDALACCFLFLPFGSLHTLMQCCKHWNTVIRQMPPANLAFYKYGGDLAWIQGSWVSTLLAKRHIGRIALPANMLVTAEQVALVAQELPWLRALNMYISPNTQWCAWAFPPRLTALSLQTGFEDLGSGQIAAVIQSICELHSLTDLRLSFHSHFDLAPLQTLEHLRVLKLAGGTGLSDAQISLLNADAFPCLTHLIVSAQNVNQSDIAHQLGRVATHANPLKLQQLDLELSPFSWTSQLSLMAPQFTSLTSLQCSFAAGCDFMPSLVRLTSLQTISLQWPTREPGTYGSTTMCPRVMAQAMSCGHSLTDITLDGHPMLMSEHLVEALHTLPAVRKLSLLNLVSLRTLDALTLCAPTLSPTLESLTLHQPKRLVSLEFLASLPPGSYPKWTRLTLLSPVADHAEMVARLRPPSALIPALRVLEVRK